MICTLNPGWHRDNGLPDAPCPVGVRTGSLALAEHLRLRLEEPATLEEVSVTGVTRLAGTERKRLQFEVVNADGNRLRILGVITLVTDPGATNEIEEDMGKRQPFRNELKALFQEIRAGLIP